jgi:SAM-dependent methyltransferase
MPYDDDVHSWVKTYYGEVLRHTADLKTGACCATAPPPPWLAERLARVHEDVAARSYGCGNPFPEALDGATVLDLGCGAGRDVYVLAQLVGARGRVVGVDMTEAQLDVARRHVAWHTDRFGYREPNVAFHQAYIEDLSALPLRSGAAGVVVSNCVVNLSPRKDLVLREVFRLLAPGGELYLCDVFADRRLPDAVAFDPALHAECLGGAMYYPDFLALARRTGFRDPRELSCADVTVRDATLARRVGAARFTSRTLRLFKLDHLDDHCEDYGHVATYRGTLPDAGALFRLDDHHVFEAHRPERVCGNTAAMLHETRFAPHFAVTGDRATHFGAFPCGETLAARVHAPRAGTPGAACC